MSFNFKAWVPGYEDDIRLLVLKPLNLFLKLILIEFALIEQDLFYEKFCFFSAIIYLRFGQFLKGTNWSG